MLLLLPLLHVDVELYNLGGGGPATPAAKASSHTDHSHIMLMLHTTCSAFSTIMNTLFM